MSSPPMSAIVTIGHVSKRIYSVTEQRDIVHFTQNATCKRVPKTQYTMSMATRLGGMDAAFAEGGGDHWEDLAGHVSLLGSSSPHSGSADSHAEHHEDESSGLVIMFLAFSLIAGTAMHTISDKFSLPVPYTVLMLILGMVL
eukprot:601328-Amorphochlora_amoeboformis.AAC.1